MCRSVKGEIFICQPAGWRKRRRILYFHRHHRTHNHVALSFLLSGLVSLSASDQLTFTGDETHRRRRWWQTFRGKSGIEVTGNRRPFTLLSPREKAVYISSQTGPATCEPNPSRQCMERERKHDLLESGGNIYRNLCRVSANVTIFVGEIFYKLKLWKNTTN